ncbi:hypothetical protein CVT25_006108 [Psilocybe cyanescens]|uniref:Uncharacterized protein n=1 Tax=Psilocybe cyanescens TaxID=93625 RepID=A0A409XIM1_PSICY|nr:hypothetical protein CVT25_006108 [Psilocybe cyanescens]
MNSIADVVVNSGGDVIRGPDSIIVDNTDPEILYKQGWSTDNSTMDSILRPERPFNNTLHAAFVHTELTYNFTGSYVEAWVAGSTSFSCFLDGIKVDWETSDSNHTSSSHNPLLLSPVCMTGIVPPKLHSLKIMVNGTTKSPIWLDLIRYTPTNTTDMRLIPSPVREFSLTKGRHHEFLSEEWDNQGSYVASTTPGASLIFNFTGASVAGLGIYDNSFAHNSSVASYAVDGGEAVFLIIENLSSNELVSLNNQILFQTPLYPPGQHQIQILYHGSSDSETAPLILTSMVVHNHTMNLDTSSDLTLPITSTNLAPNPSSTSPPTSGGAKLSSQKDINRTVPIILGLCGALLIILCALGFIYYRRRRLRLHQLASSEDRIVDPFYLAPDTLISPHTKGMRQHRPDPGTNLNPNPNNIVDASISRLRKGRGLLQVPVLSSILRVRGTSSLHPVPSSHRQVIPESDSVPQLRRPSLRLLVHQDSGVRLPRPVNQESEVIVVEVPPTYTPL